MFQFNEQRLHMKVQPPVTRRLARERDGVAGIILLSSLLRREGSPAPERALV